MLKTLFNPKYLIYGSSIVFSRGLEYAILFFAAAYLTKEIYGEFEYYKKLIEVSSIFFAFGFPSLIMSYTKSNKSKDYFYFLSVGFVLLLGIVGSVVGYFFDFGLFIIPFLFYALFFTGGITQSYILVKHNAVAASYFKILVSLVFYVTIFVFIYFFHIDKLSLVYANYVLFPIMMAYTIYVFTSRKITLKYLKKYFRLFKKLLYGSMTMVVSDFANILFVFTDIFIIKILSDNANSDIASFGFALNIAAIILIIPTTILQVNIEKLKQDNFNQTKILNKQISLLVVVVTAVLLIFYYILVEYFFLDYKDTFWLFVLIIVAKIFQGLSNLFGTNMLILKKYNTNLYINIFFLILNIGLCVVMYKYFWLIGIAISSVICLFLRYRVLRTLNHKYQKAI